METDNAENESRRLSSSGKSISLSLALQNQNSSANLTINQVDDSHYTYSRGSTRVHVQTYKKNDIGNESEMKNMFLKGVQLISALLALIMIVITLVIKLTGAITDEISSMEEDEYMLILYCVGFAWITYYQFRGTFKYNSHVKFWKSNQSSNRWLKGVVVLFGFAIVLKNGLEFLTFVTTDVTNCEYNQVEAALVFMHALFIIAQVKYLFQFAKVFIRNCSTGSRIGLMYIISVNLSTWIASIVDETLIALDEGHTSTEDEATTPAPYSSNSTITSYVTTDNGHDEATTLIPHSSNSNISFYVAADDGHGGEQCQCHSAFCQTVHVAETFLFPFVVEFSLVASCMLYINWSNIGKYPPPCEVVIKPSYKFYGKYTGAALGSVTFFLMVIFLIVLGTSGSNKPEDEKTYFTEYGQLLYYDGFLMGLQIIMLLATLVGFYLFYKTNRPLEHIPMLDQVLLVVCLLGPLAMNIFSMIAVIIGPDNKTVTWVLTLLHPLVDVFQSLLQLVFILYGLKREPTVSEGAKERETRLRFGMKEHCRDFDAYGETSSEDGGGHISKNYLRGRKSSITSIVSRLANVQSNPTSELHHQSFPNDENENVFFEEKIDETISTNNKDISFSLPAIVVCDVEDEKVDSNEERENDQKLDKLAESPDFSNDKRKLPRNSILKIVSETKVTKPDMLRSWLRDVIFFLLVANASLWLFESVNGTAFTIYQFESIFYGASGWTTIRMICRPLSLFFRMHSAGCLFEMWSFA